MKIRSLLAAALLGISAVPASAQSWDAPMFFAPRPMDDLGAYLFWTDRSVALADDATGLKVVWRQSGNLNLGLHAGLGNLSDAGETIMLGAELYGGLGTLAPGSGLDIAWNLGAGAIFGDNYTFFSVPLGASIGVRLGSGNVQVAPYVHPRVSLDIAAVDVSGVEETDTELGLSVDIGADVNLGSRWILRGGYSAGDRDAFGIGLAMRWPRGISVVR